VISTSGSIESAVKEQVLKFQSLKGIIGDFNTLEFVGTDGDPFVSIPERDYR
jgi:hypothetical protein